DSFTFELSKVEEAANRERMVANLRNVDEDLAFGIAAGLGMPALPKASAPAAEPVTSLEASPALSILANGPESFAGRKVGVLVSNGASADAVRTLTRALKAESANIEIIAPTISGVTLDDGRVLPGDQMVGGGPSVLYDAVAVIVSADGAAQLAAVAPAKDFVSDAHAHCKFVGYTPEAEALFAAAGVTELDAGYRDLTKRGAAKKFVEGCRDLRYWDRTGVEPS
ncbi:MAG TPA: catalase-related domain-containing protein, partial [Acidimicrobiales bacterium]